MTGNLYLDLAISLAGVAILVAVSYALGAWRSATLDEDAAVERLAFDEPDFRPGEFFASRDGKSAVLVSQDRSEVAFVFPVGDGLSTRRLRAGGFPVTAQGSAVLAVLRDPSRWTLKLAAADEAEAERWAGRLSGADYSAGDGVS
jgi:hypothetical protein